MALVSLIRSKQTHRAAKSLALVIPLRASSPRFGSGRILRLLQPGAELVFIEAEDVE